MQFIQFWWILFVIFIYPDHGIDSHFEKEASAFTSPCEVSLVADQTRTETKWCHNTSLGEESLVETSLQRSTIQSQYSTQIGRRDGEPEQGQLRMALHLVQSHE